MTIEMINKNKFRVASDKKLLRKVGKQWVVVGTLALALLGGGAVMATTVTHADTNSPVVKAQDTNNVKKQINSNLDKAYQATQSASGSSVASSNSDSNGAKATQPNATPQGIMKTASLLHANMLNNAQKPNTTPSSASAKSNAASQSVSSASSKASSSNDAMNTLNLGTKSEQARGWNFVQNGVRNNDFDNAKPSATSSASSATQSASSSASTSSVAPSGSISASAKPSFNSAYQSYMAQMSGTDSEVASMNSANADNNSGNNKNNKAMLKDNAQPDYFSGGVIKTGNDDGLNYKVYKNGGVEFTDGTANSYLSDFGYDSLLGEITNSDVHNAKAIKFDNGVNTSNVTNMSDMFKSDTALTSIDLSNLNTSNVTSMMDMFQSDTNLQSVKMPKTSTGQNADISKMFDSDTALTSIDLSNFNTSNVTNMRYMFNDDTKLQSVKMPKTSTGQNADISYMFDSDTALTSIDLSNLDTSNVTNMGGMFNGDTALTSIDLSNLNTSNVTKTDMTGMFYDDTKLQSVKMPKTSIGQNVNMSQMFECDTALTSIDLSNLNTSNVTDMSDMFQSDTKLQSVKMPNSSTGKNAIMYEMFGGNTALTNIDLSNFNTSNVSSMLDMFQSDTNLQSVTIHSSNTKITSDAELPTMYKKDTNDNYTSATPNDFSKGNVGTFVPENTPLDTINYQYNGKTLATQQFEAGASDYNGDGYNNLDVNNINDINIPTGYRLANSDNYIPFATGTYNVPIVLNIKTDTINYINGMNNQYVSSFTIAGTPSTSTNINWYNYGQNKMPGGWNIDLTKNTNPQFSYDGGTHDVYIEPNQISDTVNYVYNGNIMHSAQYSGNNANIANQGDDISTTTVNAGNNVPAGFHAVNNAQITINGTTHTINITPNTDTDYVDYCLNGNVIATSPAIQGNDVASHINGTFTISNGYEPGIPANYHLVNGDGIDTNQLTFNHMNTHHRVNIAPNSETDTVIYSDITNNNRQVGTKSITGLYNTSDGNAVTSSVPAGYHLAQSGTGVYTPNGVFHEKVAPNQATDTVSFHDIYSDIDGMAAPASVKKTGNLVSDYTVSAPAGWAIVNPDGLIASGTNNVDNDSKLFQYKAGNQTLDVAPVKDGLTYKYDKPQGTIEFTGGTASDNLGGLVSYNQSIKSIIFDDIVNTGTATNMFSMLSNDDNLQAVNLGSNFDTSHVTNMNDMFNSDSNLDKIVIKSNRTKLTNDSAINNTLFNTNSMPTLLSEQRQQMSSMLPALINGGLSYISPSLTMNSTLSDLNNDLIKEGGSLIQSQDAKAFAPYMKKKLSDLVFGSWYKQLPTKDSRGNNQTLSTPNDFAKGNIGTFVRPINIPKDTINYQYKGKTLATHQFSENGHDNKSGTGYNNLDVTNSNDTGIPSNYHLISNDNIPFDDGIHNIQIAPNQVTDKVNYVYNHQIINTSAVKGNTIAAQGADNTSMYVTSSNAKDIPSYYHLANTINQVSFDGKTKNIAIAPNQATDKINYMCNGQKIGSTAITGNTSNAKDSSSASDTDIITQTNIPGGLPQGYKLTNTRTSIPYDGKTHAVAVEPLPSFFNVIEYIDDNGQGSDVGDTSAYGQEGTDVPDKVIEDDVPKDYQLSPSQTLPVQFTKDNVIKVAVQNDDNKNSDMVVGTAFLTLLYQRGTHTEGQVLRLHINGNIGDSDIVINPQDYDKPGYSVASSDNDWHIPFKYSDVTKFTHDFSRYNREHTFTYEAKPVDIDIKYVDTQTGQSVTNPVNNQNVTAYDGDTIDLEDAKASNGIISVDGHDYNLQLPTGYHLAHTNNYIRVASNGSYIKKESNGVGGFRSIRMPLMKLTLGIKPHFRKPTSNSSVTPVQPASASSASTEPSLASVVPSNASQSVALSTSTASSVIAPSSTASVTPSVAPSSVTSTKASSAQPSSVAPANVSVKPSSISTNKTIARSVIRHVSHKHVTKKHVIKPTTHHINHKKMAKHDSKRLNHQVTQEKHKLNTVERHIEARKATETKMVHKLVHAKKTIKRSQHKLTYLRHNKRHVKHTLRRITRNKVAIKHAKRVVRTAKQARPRFVHAKAAPAEPMVDKSATTSVKAPVATPKVHAKSTAITYTNRKKLPQTSEAANHAGIIAIVLMVISVILASFDKVFSRKHNE